VATGLRNLPCHRADANPVWLEILLAPADLVARSKQIGFSDNPDLATCEIGTYGYRVLHAAARPSPVTHRRQLAMGHAIAQAWQQLRAAFPRLTGSRSTPDPRNPPAQEGPPAERHRPTWHTQPAR
jgi:hypothetical protein